MSKPRAFRFRAAACLLLMALVAGLTARSYFAAAGDGPAKLELHKGDRISVLGNTLADRMQHDGWLETVLHARYPELDLVFRNLGFSGDEIDPSRRIRSAAFGSPDEWLKRTQADVVFAFFGYNESFAGEAGLPKFKSDLEAFIKNTRAQKYNGESNPRLVLFSPIAHEDLKDPNLPDGKENNTRLALYTKVMAEVAAAQRVPFVNLFTATQRHYAQGGKPLTFNGVHLTGHGNEQVARIIDAALFGPAPKADAAQVEKVRQAVLDKNFYWFNRYRTVDGYSIYGGRADLKFVGGQTNRVVMQREMEILDEMTALRDRRVWAVARGGDLKVDDGKTSPFVGVETNKPGPLPGGKHLFLDPEESVKKMTVGKNLKVNVFASEKDFPELVNPVQMSWDPAGRLWVAVWPTYPHWKPKEPMNDKIIVLEDTNGDGRADKCTTFADGLHCPTGFELWNGGVLVANCPELLFLKDTDGDGKADVKRSVLSGLDSADTHHASNSFVLDPGGALYFQEGTFHHTQVEHPWGPAERCANAGVFRYEPRNHKFDVYVAYGFANPHGHVFDRWGQDIVVDGTGANPYHAALFSGHLDYPNRHNRPPQVYQQKTRPCPAMEYLSSKHFPPEFQGNLLVPNVIGFQGILRYRVVDKGASFDAIEEEPILSSTDPNFRPSDLRVGPDGAIYFLDWHNPIIGHMQHNLRDPSRDREHGRIYRVTYVGAPPSPPVKIAGEPVEKLLDLLKDPEDRVRYRTRIELGARKTDEVIAAAKKWLDKLDKADPEYQHHVLEGLWLHQNHNVVDVDLLKRVLGSPDFRARAAATRVLCYWRDRVPEALELFKKQAADEHPRVRLEAVRAASFFKDAAAVEVVLIAAEKPMDTYLEFVRGETMRALDPYVKAVIAKGQPLPFSTGAGARFLLRNVPTDDLLKMKRGKGVYQELLSRRGVRDEFRKEAVAGLAKLESKTEPAVLLEALAGVAGPDADESVAFDLVRLLTSRRPEELAAARGALEKMATQAPAPVTRQLGYVALVAADNDVEKAWSLALKSARTLQDFVSAMPLLRDPGHRAALYPKVEPLLQGLPKGLETKKDDALVKGRYVRVELPGKLRTLTLAEVEVFSDGKNVARQGKAKQSTTSHGGVAGRAIDGNKNPSYAAGGQTHTKEGTDDPWWEVDLGAEYPINSIVVYNRGDDNLSNRLSNYTLKVLDKGRSVVFERSKQPTPVIKSAFEVAGVSQDRMVRHAAMQALTTVRGQEAATFKSLAAFVAKDADRHAAVQALQRIPSRDWPKEEVKPLLNNLLTYIRTVPVADRTAPAALDALQLADALASQLPLAEARAVRKELGELGVRVIRVGTVHDQMLFDKERIVVKAGRPVEVLFENTDIMPHNFVVVQPGSLEEVGNLAEAQATQPGAAERHYVPTSKKVMHASRLLAPRDADRVAFTAPTKPGVYPYVCTYPGHWRRMYGAMYVVEDLDEYLANPEAYLAAHPLPAADELLKYNRPRTEWKYDELVAEVEKLDHGRSFAHGKQLFTVANCVACHKLNGAGTELGPDLAKLDVKMKPAELLKEVLEPSHKINEKFQSYVVELQSGKVHTGLIVEDTPAGIKLIENPLVKSAPLFLKKEDIAERAKSPTSIMPKGLLDKLTREEVLDLMAYVIARGDARHPVFQGAHEHGHGKKGH